MARSSIPAITSAGAARALLAPIFDGQEREHFVAVWLDRRLRPIGAPEVLSIGSDRMTVVDPRYILRRALLANATAMIVAHNHPSGDVSPSSEDYACTSKLKAACDVVGVQLLDHLIHGDDGDWFSFQETGRLL